MSDLLNKASLVMVPSGYKEDTVYSVVPTDGSGDLSFTRASNGTRVNSAGLVEVAPWNLLEYSEDFSNAYWSKDPGATVDSNVATAPNGTTTADRLNFAGAGQAVYTIQTFSGANTFSVYLKGEGANIGKQIYLELPSGINVTLTGEWQRFEVNANNATSVAIKRLNSGQASAVLAWGVQVNAGTLKPYFPTTDRLNVPRLTYQNGGGGCPSLLLEKQSTNLAFPSEDLTAWSTGGMTNTANQTTSPDGTQNADKSTIGSTTRYYDVITQGITTVSGTTYTTSFFAKKGTGIEAIYFFQGDGGGKIAKWNLNNGAYIGYASADGYSAFTSQTSESLGNGWYRFTATYTASGTSGNYVIGVSTNINDSVTPIAGNGTDFVYVWGLQYEASSYPTSYIPTTSSSATRVADACFKTGISSLIGQTQGSVFFDFIQEDLSSIGEGVLWYMKGTGTGERYVTALADGRLIYVENNGSTIAQITKTGFTNGRHKCAIAYATNDFVFYVDGVQIGTDTSGTPSGFSEFGLRYYISTYTATLKANEAVIFPTRLTNAELASLTTI